MAVIEGNGVDNFFILGLCLFCFALYFNSLNNNFVSDDRVLIVQNPLIKSFKFLPLFFQKDIYAHSGITAKMGGKMYRPLQLLTYSIDYKIWRFNPFGFHLSNTMPAHFLWGNYYFTAGEFAKAADNYNKALEKEQKLFYAQHNLSLCYARLGEHSKALDLALECFKANPYYMVNLVWLADLYAKQRKFGEAQKYYSKALEIDPDNQRIKQRLNARY